MKIPKKFAKHLLSLYEDMGIDFETAKQELKDLISFMNSLPDQILLYRILHLENENVLDTKELGSHYSYDKKNLLRSHYLRGPISFLNDEGETVLVTVRADKKQIDIVETLSNNILYPNEMEITLKDKGTGVTIIDIEKI